MYEFVSGRQVHSIFIGRLIISSKVMMDEQDQALDHCHSSNKWDTLVRALKNGDEEV